ncbi:hypothetical protein SAMN05216570_3475 [Dyella sp. OK004]|uniref:hypothetical protein n=1 Tax=Dyella sp. OK004 TaxID=1855292 RepID=UPI0008ED028D|nr:hypothetical protein [Dyella sp. OK004]SFS17128.1 hypothetical protein SAMN05216570_3475 [Dyella sp. OK004]
MKSSIPHVALYAATLAGLLMLSGCGKHEETPPAANAPAAPASTPATTPPANPAPSSTAPAPSSTTNSPATKPATTGTSPTTAVPASTEFRIAAVTVGNQVADDHRVSEAKNHFAPNDKAIYASVATQGNTKGVTLNATWTYLEGQARPITSTSQSIATDGPAVTTFEVRNPSLWPAGKYQVVISLDGKPVSTQGFDVAKI